MHSRNLQIIGNDKLLLCTDAADIPIVRSPSVSPSFCSFSLNTDGLTLKSEHRHREGVFRHVFYGTELKSAEICDRFDSEERIFIRSCTVYEELSFSFAFEERVKVFSDLPLKNQRGSFPTLCLYLPAYSSVPGFKPSTEDRFLMIGFCGEVDFDPESATGRFLIGESRMIICEDTDPNRLFTRAVIALGRYSQPEGTGSKLKAFEEKDPAGYLNALISLTDECGFVLCDPNALNIDPLTQYFAVRAFIHAGRIKPAKAIIDAYCRIFAEKGSILWCEEGGRRPSRSAFEESITPALIILAALSLPDGSLTEKQLSLLCEMMKRQKSLLVNHMMPFNGNEDEPEARYIPHQGSALATLLFIHSGRELCRYLKIKGSRRLEDIEQSVDSAASHFHGNFIKDGIPFLNCPTREVIKAQPRFKFGYCEYCSPRSADPEPCWVHKSAHGIYLCPSCLKNQPGAAQRYHLDRNGRRISYKTVLLAALIGSDIYPRGLVRQVVSSVIFSDVRSSFDAATLCYLARKYELDKRYVDAADEILFTKEKQKDEFELRIDGESRRFSVVDAKSCAVMYMTFEYPAIPKRKMKKRPEGAMFTQTEDVR